MTACGRPGCDGTIDEGWCDTCGLAARAAAPPTRNPALDWSTPSTPSTPSSGTRWSTPTASGPAAASPPASRWPAAGPATAASAATGPHACGRPGCDGTIADGFCDTCGLASRGPATPPAPAPADPGPADPGTSGPDPTGSGPNSSGPNSSGSNSSGPTGSGSGSGSGSGPATSGSGPVTSASGPATGSWSRSFSSGVATAGSRPSRRGSTRSSGRSARSRLGAGLVDVPAVPRVDPASALLRDPQVAESKRFCSTCGRPVGRGRDGQPGRVEGFCPHDGTRFSFTPKLTPGTLVAGQYEVRGCLAHGGLGWIYLAQDRNVNDRWVVLKGLLDAGDADAMAAAVAERRFLAEVEHPGIVNIFNFVQHRDADGRSVGYIVMEYVGGSSLKDIMNARRREDGGLDPLPVGQAIAYALEVLPALGYLHGRGLVYCDFKPENVIQYDQQLKLIDLGAVIRQDDHLSAVFGTVGYQAPEISTDGPSPMSDVHTVGRSLAVLALGMPPARRGTPTPLPETHEHEVLALHPSFDRLLRRATDPDPLRRFASTDEMADQLGAVLREALSTLDGLPRPVTSTLFGPTRGAFAADLLLGGDGDGPGRPRPELVADHLPVPLVDPSDPAAGLLAATASVDRDQVQRLVRAAGETPSTELRLRLVRAHLDVGDLASAGTAIEQLEADEPGDWRLDWFRGVRALLARDLAGAGAAFDTVYATLPGEPAAKLALAAALEAAGTPQLDAAAEQLYTLIARCDPAQADAVFGRARIRLRAGDRVGATEALDAVPATSSHYVAAQLAAVEATVAGTARTTTGQDPAARRALSVSAAAPAGPRAPAVVSPAVLRGAAARVEALPLDRATDQRTRAALFTAAVSIAPQDPGGPLLGVAWNEHDLRLALEGCLRASARLTHDPEQRIALVDRANAERPRTWT